jgi:capsular exopolysaccharide synthesis family protein
VIRSDDVKKMVNLPCLARIPLVQRKKRKSGSEAALLITQLESDSAFCEAHRLLRLKLLRQLDEQDKVLMVTSSVPSEGKTTLSANLALLLARDGKKVLLIDGDLRIPSVAKKMKIKSVPGLTDLLKGDDVDLEQFRTPHLDTWYIMPSGPLPPNPSELLGSKRMEMTLNMLSEHFDYIVVDLPPINIVSDALAISQYIDGIIVVIREDYTEKKELENCIRQLRLSNVKVLGCVMNETKEGKGYYSKYRYKRYYRYYKTYGNYDAADKK